MYFVLYFCVIFFSLIPMAFFTLLERRILGNFHVRFGPFMVGPLGLFQPFSDAVKLFSKSDFLSRFSFKFLWLFSPILSLVLYFYILLCFPLGGGEFFLSNMFLIFICFLSFSVYFFMFGGYYSGGKFSLVGAYRSVAQMISYEVILIFLFISYFYLIGSWSLSYSVYELSGMSVFFSLLFLFVWSFVMLAESNRLPYDFLEGESELVSGFNTEYWGGFFSFLFIFEYGSILFFCLFSSFFLFFGWFCILFFGFFLFFFLWVRVSLPRFRFDLLMDFSWSSSFFFVILMLLYFFVM